MEPVITEALVLTTLESRDDRVVTLMTPEMGRIPCFARGAAKSQKRFGANIDPLTLVEAQVVPKGDGRMLNLRRAHVVYGFPVIKGDLLRMAMASVMVETLLALVPDHGVEPAAYTTLHKALHHLDRPETRITEELLALFELRMLFLSGLLPELDAIGDLSEESRETLYAWLDQLWEPLDPPLHGPTCKALERLIQEASGRPLRSRELLDELL